MFNLFKQSTDGSLIEILLDTLTEKTYLTNTALDIAASRIADVISKQDIEFFSPDKYRSKNKDAIEYCMNVRANPNQTGTEFWREVIKRTILNREQGVIVFQLNSGDYYCSESFTESSSVLLGKTYSDVLVTIDNDSITLGKTFSADDVLHLRYENKQLLEYLAELDGDLGTAWSAATKGLASRSGKYKITMPGQSKILDSDGKVISNNEYGKMIENRLSKPDVVGVLCRAGVDVTGIDSKATLTSSDIEKVRDIVFTNVAMAMGIPKTVFYGEVTEKSDANNEMITYACMPIVEMITDSLNAKWINRQDYIAGDRFRISMAHVKHIDILDQAGNLDKLYSNGWSFNMVAHYLGIPKIDEPWADAHRFTKNYATDDSEGGEQ